MGYQIATYHGSYNIVARRDDIKYIVVHYVGDGNSSPGSARRNCIYFAGGNRNASAHIFIDDANVYEYADPARWACWHVGDGGGRYGITNQNSVGIEVCNNGGPFTDAEIDRLHWLVRLLMGRFGVPASRVVRHYDASRKQCPLYYVQNPDAWARLHATITSEYREGPVARQDAGNPVNDSGFGYRTHVQGGGWLASVRDGQWAGTRGQGLRVEALKLQPPRGVRLAAIAHVQGVGNVGYLGIDGSAPRSGTGSTDADPVIGTTGRGKRLEAVTIFEQANTTGKRLCYQGHVQGVGDTPVCHAGETCGTVGQGKRLEAVRFWYE